MPGLLCVGTAGQLKVVVHQMEHVSVNVMMRQGELEGGGCSTRWDFLETEGYFTDRSFWDFDVILLSTGRGANHS